MCGIVGKVFFEPERPMEEGLIIRTCQVLSHRGPDGERVHLKGPVGLWHRGLAIIDLSENCLLPMPNENGTLWITFNGEIYNFQELRDDLLKRGH